MKAIIVIIVFVLLVIVGETMFGWIGAIAAIGVGGAISLAVLRGSKHAGGGGGISGGIG
ncbi:MAG: hypothetical protein QF893_08855 [Alphaproteobacteria bacterium]|jgi:hypothetical protein|nr:hypothetical protein [Alphaproteobacteria bacterium]